MPIKVDINDTVNRLPYSPEVQDQIFNSFYAPDIKTFKSSLDAIDIPQRVKSAIWDARAAAVAGKNPDLSIISSAAGSAPTPTSSSISFIKSHGMVPKEVEVPSNITGPIYQGSLGTATDLYSKKVGTQKEGVKGFATRLGRAIPEAVDTAMSPAGLATAAVGAAIPASRPIIRAALGGLGAVNLGTNAIDAAHNGGMTGADVADAAINALMAVGGLPSSRGIIPQAKEASLEARIRGLQLQELLSKGKSAISDFFTGKPASDPIPVAAEQSTHPKSIFGRDRVEVDTRKRLTPGKKVDSKPVTPKSAKDSAAVLANSSDPNAKLIEAKVSAADKMRDKMAATQAAKRTSMNENGITQEDTTPAVSAEEAASKLYNKEDLAKNQEAIAKIAADYQADPRFKPVAEPGTENQSSPGVIPAQAEQAAEESKDATQPTTVEAKEVEPYKDASIQPTVVSSGVTYEHPTTTAIVRDLESRINELHPGFIPDVRRAYAESLPQGATGDAASYARRLQKYLENKDSYGNSKSESNPTKKVAKPAAPKVSETKKEEPKEEVHNPIEKAVTAAVVPPKTTSDPAPAVITPKDGVVSFRSEGGLTKLSLDKDETAVRHGDSVYILKKQKGGGFEIQDEYMSNLGHSSKTDPVEALSEHLGVKAQPKSDPAPVKGTTIESKKTEEVSKTQSPKEKKEVKSSPAPITNFKVTTGKDNAILEGPGGKTVFLEPVKGNQWQSALADGTVVRNFSLPEGVNITDYAKQNGADLFSRAKK